MPHLIKLSEVLPFLNQGTRSEIAGSYGKGSNKTLLAISYFDETPATFIVEVNRKEVIKTEDIAEAINTYNSYP